jgi:hypothetical protein
MSKTIGQKPAKTGRPAKKKSRTPQNKKPLPSNTKKQSESDNLLLVVDPDEIGFASPVQTIRTRLRITGFRQGQPEALPLDDIELENFDV